MSPNECVNLVQQQQQQAMHQQVIKIVTHLTDDVSSEDGEHFYDASSDVGHTEELPNSDKADSGVGEDSDFDLPEQALAEQIVEQVEYYFSDAHILKDAFLLKHARRNRDGFISLKLITSFKKVKHVTKDWRVVAYAVRALSKRLEVNEAGTKVRRVAPLPENDETSPSRTIVAIGLTPEKATIEAVAEMLSRVEGSIALIRILRPGNTIPPDVRQCANRYPDILVCVCAVVEFELAESARRALNEDIGLPEGVQLVELANRRGGSSKNSPAPSRPVTPQPQQTSSGASTPNVPRRNNNRRRNGPAQKENAAITGETVAPRSPYVRRQDLHLQYNSSNSSTPSHSPTPRRHMGSAARPIVQQQQQQRNGSPAARPKSASFTTDMAVSCSPPGSHSPWVRRRLGLDSGRSSPMPSADNRLSVPTNIVRMPNGPDGTRGFHFGAGKPRSASAPEAPLMVAL